MSISHIPKYAFLITLAYFEHSLFPHSIHSPCFLLQKQHVYQRKVTLSIWYTSCIDCVYIRCDWWRFSSGYMFYFADPHLCSTSHKWHVCIHWSLCSMFAMGLFALDSRSLPIIDADHQHTKQPIHTNYVDIYHSFLELCCTTSLAQPVSFWDFCYSVTT